jgi:hypothetical protein
MGRGNIAYGAKIGANHTGRVNDQECRLAEGLFIGLNVSLIYLNKLSLTNNVIL